VGRRHASRGTVGLNDRTWLDTAGHEHSDQLHLVEKFQKTGNDNIKWTVTFEDPKFYTEPWSITLPIARQNTEIMSYSCEENEEGQSSPAAHEEMNVVIIGHPPIRYFPNIQTARGPRILLSR